MTELSAEKLAELREVAGKATPGPWVAGPAGTPEEGSTRHAVRSRSDTDDSRVAYDLAATEYDEMGWRDAEHIAAFDPPTVLALLDRIADLEAWRAKIWGEAYRQGVDDERHHRVDYRKAGRNV